MDKYLLDKVPYFTQRDNKFEPFVNCFATSNAMAITYCLSLIGKTKVDVGCSADIQLEDHIFEWTKSPQVDEWIKKTFKSNWFGWAYVKVNNKKVLWDVQQYIANQLLNPFGYQAKMNERMTYEDYCTLIVRTKCPILLGGDFRTVSTVQGHICCGVGFNPIGLKEVIVHDPYGNALTGYYEKLKGNAVQYGERFFIKSNGFMY